MDNQPRRLEFLGAFFFWMTNGFNGKLQDYYSRRSARKQIINFLAGILFLLLIIIVIVTIRSIELEF
jgi:hypothetical protein